MTADTMSNGRKLVDASRVLRRFGMIASGRMDAFYFATSHDCDLKTIQERIEEIEGYLSNPELLSGSMKPGAEPRIYRDAYLAALHEAVEIIKQNLSSAPETSSRTARRPPSPSNSPLA